MINQVMPSEYIQTLWNLWNNKIVNENQIVDALKVYGYTLQSINSEGMIAEAENVKHSYMV